RGRSPRFGRAHAPPQYDCKSRGPPSRPKEPGRSFRPLSRFRRWLRPPLRPLPGLRRSGVLPVPEQRLPLAARRLQRSWLLVIGLPEDLRATANQPPAKRRRRHDQFGKGHREPRREPPGARPPEARPSTQEWRLWRSPPFHAKERAPPPEVQRTNALIRKE